MGIHPHPIVLAEDDRIVEYTDSPLTRRSNSLGFSWAIPERSIGHWYLPFSRRLYKSRNPSPSQRRPFTKEPFEIPKTVIQYLGRYTHRIAISNARIRSFENGMVTFSYKDYQDHSSIRQMTITAREFVRRYLMHVLPQGFTKIRHHGFLSNANKRSESYVCEY